MKPLFKGCGTAIITPFTADTKKIDFDSLERLLEFQLSDGVDAIIVLGTTGEAAVLTNEEKTEIIKFTVSTVGKRVPVIVGTGSNCTEVTIANSVSAERL
ncbi:MAG: dihydrodipicolinate synthase family protein, partial [Clostridiales bacterium]|nr:dihydrodipicolinate synthase family protein [Clostridiales bacterium]